MPPPGIEPGLQVPETCVISFSPRGPGDPRDVTATYHDLDPRVNVEARVMRLIPAGGSTLGW